MRSSKTTGEPMYPGLGQLEQVGLDFDWPKEYWDKIQLPD